MPAGRKFCLSVLMVFSEWKTFSCDRYFPLFLKQQKIISASNIMIVCTSWYCIQLCLLRQKLRFFWLTVTYTRVHTTCSAFSKILSIKLYLYAVHIYLCIVYISIYQLQEVFSLPIRMLLPMQMTMYTTQHKELTYNRSQTQVNYHLLQQPNFLPFFPLSFLPSFLSVLKGSWYVAQDAQKLRSSCFRLSCTTVTGHHIQLYFFFLYYMNLNVSMMPVDRKHS